MIATITEEHFLFVLISVLVIKELNTYQININIYA